MSGERGRRTPDVRESSVPFVCVESEPVGGSMDDRLRAGRTGTSSRSPSSSRAASDRGDARANAHAPTASSRLARTDSLPPKDVDVDKSTVEIDLTSSDPGHDPGRTRGYVLPSVRSLQNVRDALHRLGHSESNGRGRDSLEAEAQRQNPPRPLFRFMSRRRASEDLFRPIDPYRTKFRLFTEELEEEFKIQRAWFTRLPSFPLGRILVLQIYRHLMLRLPSMYFTRICHLFEEAEVTRPEIQGMIDGAANGWDWARARDWTPTNVSPTLRAFKHSWEEFIEIVIQEWKTLNVVSALLLGALLTMFQIDDANNDPFTRTFSLISLICAAWSLIYGGVYIMRFRTMRSMYKASGFAQEAQQSRTNVFWNVWVLLALPATWLAWSMISFFAAILSFVWTSGSSNNNPQAPSPRIELIPRIIVTALFALGMVYFVLVIRSFRSYGSARLRRPDGTAQDLALQTSTVTFPLPEASQDHSRAPHMNSTAHGNSLGLQHDTDLMARGYDVPQVVHVQAQPRMNGQADLEKGEAKAVGADERNVDGPVRRKGSPGLGGLGL